MKKKARTKKTEATTAPVRTKPATRPVSLLPSECGFVVDDDGIVREFLGHTAPLLGFAPGTATLDIRRIVRNDIAGALSEAFDTARKRKKTARITSTDIRLQGQAVRIEFEVSPARRHSGAWKIVARCRKPPRAAPGRAPDDHPMLRIRRLQRDLRHLRDEENRRQTALIGELEDALVRIHEVQEELEISNAELEATNVQLTASVAEREAVQARLERSEAAAREVLETASQAILGVSASGKIVRANEMAHRMFGYRSGQLVGRRLGALVPQGLRTAHARHIAGFFQAPERRPMGEGRDLWGVRKDGTRFPVEVGLSAIAGDEEPLAIAFISDITERKRYEHEILDNREQLRSLTNRLLTAAEDETRMWARELHDVYTQRLIAIAMELDRLARSPDQAKVYALRALESDVRKLSDDIHGMARRMHPAILDDLGLVAALKSELAAFQKHHGIVTDLRSQGVSDLPSDVALCCYRIVQEALNNVRKHADTDRVSVDVSASAGILTLVLRDKGRGFDQRAATRRGLGLLSMQERAQAVGGTASIESEHGKGTTVRIRVPVGGVG